MISAINTYAYSDTERNVLLDEFLTPIELIEACFEQTIVPKFGYGRRHPKHILDVGANDGRWGIIARKYFPNARIYGIEIMDMPDFMPSAYDAWITEDFITCAYGIQIPYDLIIGNPPFTVKEPNGFDENGKQKYKVKYKAEDFVRKALSLLNYDGFLAFILRSNFRHSIERYRNNGLFMTNSPYQVWDLTLRPSYYKEDKRTEQYGTKATNAHDNSLFVWWNQWQHNYYKGMWLDWKYKD